MSMSMKDMISEVRLSLSSHDVVRANGTFTLCGNIAVRFSIINGSKGLFVSLPRQESKKEKGKWYDDVFPVNPEARNEMNSILLKEYEKYTNGGAPVSKTPF